VAVAGAAAYFLMKPSPETQLQEQWGMLERAANGAAWASVGGLDHAQQFFIAANAWAASED